MTDTEPLPDRPGAVRAAERMIDGAHIDDLTAGLPAGECAALVAGIIAVLRPGHDPRGSLDDLPSDVAVEILVARAAVARRDHGDRMWLPISALTDEEVDAMTTSVVEGGEPYELDDVAEDGTMLNGKLGPCPTA